MEDFYIKCNSKEESELCEKWAKENNLFLDRKFDYYKDAWDLFIVRDNTYRLNEDETYNLPEKTLTDLGINNTTEKDWSKVSKEELVEEAKRRYPVGTKIKTSNITYMSDNPPYTVVDGKNYYKQDNYVWVSSGRWNSIIYENGKWAEIIPTPEVKESISDSKFIVGKWYTDGFYYIKFSETSRVENNQCWHSDYICKSNGLFEYQPNSNSWLDADKFKLLENLEEIQQYLPDGHPDKIPNKVEMKPDEEQEFKVGNYIYIIKANKDKYSEAKKEFNGDILKITSITKEKLQYVNSYWITHEGNSFSGGGFRMNGNGYIPNIHFRLATQEEIDFVTKSKEITESIKPIPNQYDLSTTITRAVKNNDPSIIARETGKSIDELCDLVDEKTTSCLTDGNAADCAGLRCPECQFSQENGKTKESAKAWLRGKSKQSLSDYQAVHVNSQEKWDFVSEKLGYTNKWPLTFKWDVFGSKSCINLNVPNYGTKGIAYKNVISFEDWLDLTGHISEWYSDKKGNDLDMYKIYSYPLMPKEYIKEKPEFSLFPNFVSKIN